MHEYVPLSPDSPAQTPLALRRVSMVLFWLALVTAVTMAVLPHPPHLPIDSMGDKFEHILAFATLTTLAAFAFPAMPPWRIAERLSFLGALIEVAQSIPALQRDCDIRDWFADTIAIVVTTVMIAGIRRLRS